MYMYMWMDVHGDDQRAVWWEVSTRTKITVLFIVAVEIDTALDISIG